MKVIPAFILLLLPITAFAASATPETSAAGLPGPARGATLSECVAQLDAQGGGWCALGPSIASVYPFPRSDPRAGWSGPTAILGAWNGMAIDKANKLIWLAASGGHADYWGNETYEIDLKTGTVTLLIPPAPGTPGGDRWPAIALGPGAAHTYDGVQFSWKTGTIFWRGVYYRGVARELWELNPSRTETRNGIAPLTWRLWRNPGSEAGAGADPGSGSGAGGTPLVIRGGNYPVSAELPDGDLLLGGTGRVRRLDPTNPFGTLTEFAATGADWSDGNLIWDAGRNVAWIATRNGHLLRLRPGGGYDDLGERPAGAGLGMALRQGRLVFWDGGGRIHEYDPGSPSGAGPDAGTWRMWEWDVPGTLRKGDSRVYSKWAYLPEEDVFVGLRNDSVGVLVYRHPGEGGQAVSALDAQALIDAAPSGGTVTVPAGIYGSGIKVTKPLTVTFAPGARFLKPVDGKGVVLVEDAAGPVVLDGLVVTDPPLCGSNCAGVRISGADYHVTIRNFRILNQEMGVLTDNRGGTLILADGEIGQTGGGSDLSHVIYAGVSDRLELRNVTVRDSNGLGHLVKSRAAVTTIEGSKLLGGTSRHSRILDVPCGGAVTLRDVAIHQSANTDNAEMMLIGGEPDHCTAYRDGHVTLERVTMTSDADRPHASRTAVFKWRAPNAPDIAWDAASCAAFAAVDLLMYWPGNERVPLPECG